jgi:hypothetical protein
MAIAFFTIAKHHTIYVYRMKNARKRIIIGATRALYLEDGY